MAIFTSLRNFTGIASAQRILDHLARRPIDGACSFERVDTSKTPRLGCSFGPTLKVENEVRAPRKRIIQGPL